MKQTQKPGVTPVVASWFAVLVLAAAIFGVLYWAAFLFNSDRLARWWSYIFAKDPNRPSLILVSILILALAILVAVVVHAFGRGQRKLGRQALMLGSWVVYLPALVSGLFAIAGLSYLMFYAFVAGGAISMLAWLLIRNNSVASPDWRHWIATGVVGRGAVDRPDNGSWRVVPLVFVAIGFAITVISFVQVLQAHRERRLQEDGLYATVRHPQHLGIAMWTLGLAMAASTTAAYMSWFTMLYCYILLAFWEEKQLGEQFGAAYGDYRRSTPFMIPFVRIAPPLPQFRWQRVAALAGYYLTGITALCLIMQAIGVEVAWYG